jgi:hypothetical protein
MELIIKTARIENVVWMRICYGPGILLLQRMCSKRARVCNFKLRIYIGNGFIAKIYYEKDK